MKIAIIGSRGWTDERRISDYIFALPKDTIIVSGGARGVDSIAIKWAQFFDLKTQVFIPDWDAYGKYAGLARNTNIVEVCDRLVAFWDGQSRGTMDSIMKARKAGKPVEVIRP